VASHFSRWSYPGEVTPGPSQQVHIVEKGDTLWDLGRKYLGNPFAWPQIWELNPWVKDPHWIYPGDPILVDSSRSVVPAGPELAPGEVADLQPDLPSGRRGAPQEYAFTFQDFIKMPYLVPSPAETSFRKHGGFKISSQQDETKNVMADGDIIYLDGGSNQGLKTGDRLVVTEAIARKIYHPDDRRQARSLGDVVQQEGVVRITKTYPDQSVATIERCLDGIRAGAYALPFQEPATLPNLLRTDIGSPIQVQQPVSKIIFIGEGKPLAAGGDMIITDRGAKDGLKVGDVLLSARSKPLDPSHKATASTNFYVGQVIVVKVEDKNATCRVLRTTEEMMVGDILSR
jgi:hypothetical protein